MSNLDGLSRGTDYEDEIVQDVDYEDADGNIDIALLESEVLNRDYAEYVIQAAKKDVKCEDYLVRQITYVARCFMRDQNVKYGLSIRIPTERV
jgi:hypothetical protein